MGIPWSPWPMPRPEQDFKVYHRLQDITRMTLVVLEHVKTCVITSSRVARVHRFHHACWTDNFKTTLVHFFGIRKGIAYDDLLIISCYR